MPSYQAPTKDMEFVLHDVLKISESQTPGYEDLDRDITGAILGEAGRIASEVLAPLNAIGDTEGCSFENGVVRMPTGFKGAFDEVRDGGWNGLDLPEEFGGQDMPNIVSKSNKATGRFSCL